MHRIRIHARLASCFVALAATLTAQTFYAPKSRPAVWVPPNKPHTKLADLMKKHAGRSEWRETIVKDAHLESEYIFARPGTRTLPAAHPDTREWWVVMDGQVRFEIEGVDSFIASKGSMVQVPMQTIFSWEVVGDKPALLFDTNIAGAKLLYVADRVSREALPKMPGFDWIPVSFQRRAGQFEHGNRPHVTFDELARKLESGELKGTQRVVQDDRGTANFIYGYEKNLPPLDVRQRGHYHPESAEYWLILRGQIRYPVEGYGVIVASEGDVVYIPTFTFHAPRWFGPGPSCRLAMNGYPHISHLFDPQPETK